tara:strand:- start:294 stop:725 length:432 start_codon:yes stop_codon:yes gene_type:complete
MLISPHELKYDDVLISDVFTFSHKFINEDLELFSRLTGDTNSLHLDYKFAQKNGFESQVVYGMLSASLFSRLIGVYCPGKNGLYLSQTIDFKKPLYLEKEVTVKGTVIKKFDNFDMVEIKTEIFDLDDVFVSGVARAKFLINE